MAKSPEESRSTREKRRQEHAEQSRVTDDEVTLDPVQADDELEGLDIQPIEPPPFTTRSRSTRSAEEKEATSEPEEQPAARAAGNGQEQSEGSVATAERPASRVVIGDVDSRKLYTPTNVFPNRAVCHLIVTYPLTPPGKAWAATGSFIGSRHVLTAGHVLYKAAEGGWSKTIRVIPGRDGNTFWFGSEMLTWPNYKQRSVEGWSEDQDIDYDYGLITLNTGFSVGSFGLLYLSDASLDTTTAYLIGYPADLGSPKGSQQYGVPSGGPITDYDSTLVYYSMDTYNGQSGAGVYRFWNGKRAIFAVHGGGYDSDENRAARITQARHDQIRAWQKADE